MSCGFCALHASSVRWLLGLRSWFKRELSFCDWQSGDEAQPDVHALKLEVGSKLERCRVVARVLLIRHDRDFRAGKGNAALGCFRGVLRVSIDVLTDPVGEPPLQLIGFVI